LLLLEAPTAAAPLGKGLLELGYQLFFFLLVPTFLGLETVELVAKTVHWEGKDGQLRNHAGKGRIDAQESTGKA
jgi:hypothetical protein